MAYIYTGLKNSVPFMTEWLLKWIDACKKQTYPDVWQKERPLCLKKTLKRNSSQQLQTHNLPTNDVENANATN